MSNTVPALGYLDRNAEQILILENQFCPISEKILKKIIYIHNMRTYYLFLCSCAFYNKCHFYSLFMLHLVICTTGNCINTHTHTHTHTYANHFVCPRHFLGENDLLLISNWTPP